LIKVLQALTDGSYTFTEDSEALKYFTDIPPNVDASWKEELSKLSKDFKLQDLKESM
jgi:hypothetical protein